MGYKYHPKTREELLKAIEKEIELQGDNADLNCIDTSAITDMSLLFYNTQFNGDISKWDVSNVTNMTGTFNHSRFNGDISQWNVSKVENMASMFMGSQFNGDISQWNVSNVGDMVHMFEKSQFNGDISKWNVSNVKWIGSIFYKSKFNGDVSNWNIDNVIDDRSCVLEYGIFRGYSDNRGDESGLTYSGKGESSLVCYDEDSQPEKRNSREETIFDKLKNVFGKIFGTL